jgi:hypothetical protein
MKYKPTYGDKQREKQKHKKEEAQRDQKMPTGPADNEEVGQTKNPEGRVDRKDKNAA